MATENSGSGVQTSPMDKNLEMLGKFLKQVRLIVMGDIDEDLPSMGQMNEFVKAFNAHKRAWAEIPRRSLQSTKG